MGLYPASKGCLRRTVQNELALLLSEACVASPISIGAGSGASGAQLNRVRCTDGRGQPNRRRLHKSVSAHKPCSAVEKQ